MDSYEFVETGYGKNYVRLLHVRRDGPVHTIKEYEVNTALTLDSKKDYLQGDNSDVIATDSQKNTVYILAKNYGVKCPEEFALLLCQHFLSKYRHVNKARIYVKEHPWKRIEQGGRQHNHAFISTPVSIRFCTVTQKRGDVAQVKSGIQDLRVLKTTQSAFVNFVNDEYRSLADTDDRIFSTIIYSCWEYSTTHGLNFDTAWETVKNCILEMFAGPPDTGIFSPSVQETLYLAEKLALDKVSQISNIEIVLPNAHYFNVNLSKFPKVGSMVNNDVFMPVDKPSGNITATLGRKIRARL